MLFPDGSLKIKGTQHSLPETPAQRYGRRLSIRDARHEMCFRRETPETTADTQTNTARDTVYGSCWCVVRCVVALGGWERRIDRPPVLLAAAAAEPAECMQSRVCRFFSPLFRVFSWSRTKKDELCIRSILQYMYSCCVAC